MLAPIYIHHPEHRSSLLNGSSPTDLNLTDIVEVSAMHVFAFYVDDDRYTVPTLKLESCVGEEQALARAKTMLGQSPHHLGVEACLDGERLFGIGTYQCA